MDFLKFVLRRLLAVPITLFFITAVLYAIIMLAPAEERAMLYWGPNARQNLPLHIAEARTNQIIEEHGLNDPYPQQYWRWASSLLRGGWGFSPVVNDDVLSVLLNRTPVTAELTLYSILFLIPLGLIGGVLSGWRQGGRFDAQFRLAAFAATSIPPFILGLFLLSIFYIGLNWFPPGRTGILELAIKSRTTFRPITGLLTIDGLLNGRPDVTLDTFRHLVLPVFTLSLVHWATLGPGHAGGHDQRKREGLRHCRLCSRPALPHRRLAARAAQCPAAGADQHHPVRRFTGDQCVRDRESV